MNKNTNRQPFFAFTPRHLFIKLFVFIYGFVVFIPLQIKFFGGYIKKTPVPVSIFLQAPKYIKGDNAMEIIVQK